LDFFQFCYFEKFYKHLTNNNSLHLYSAFLGTQGALHREGNLLNHHQCAASTWMMRCDDAIVRQNAHHTPAY